MSRSLSNNLTPPLLIKHEAVTKCGDRQTRMPATYTYNDAIEAAKLVVMDVWKHHFAETEPEKYLSIMLDVIGRLDRQKRPSRQKRSKATEQPPTP